jgi:hypothetical protein
MVHLRDRILAQKKSFRKFIINLFVRETDVQRYHKITYRNYSAIKVSQAVTQCVLELQLNSNTENFG